jgi:hypothetical protein
MFLAISRISLTVYGAANDNGRGDGGGGAGGDDGAGDAANDACIMVAHSAALRGLPAIFSPILSAMARSSRRVRESALMSLYGAGLRKKKRRKN